MALRVLYKKRIKGVTLKSGHVYVFRYSAWENDPIPLYFHMYSFSGTHPKTGRQWRFCQGVNLNYLPRSQRKRFVKEWVKVLKRTKGDMKLTWRIVKTYYPFMDIAVRRYFYSPTYYIKNLKEVPFDDLEKAVVGSFHKDFSKQALRGLASKYKKVKKRGLFGSFKDIFGGKV